MPIEPNAVTTVSRRPIVGADKPRTLAEYQASIIARFGRLPSWPQLAKIEARSVARVTPVSVQPATLTPRLLAQKAAQAAKSERTRKRILDALTEPMTAADIARRIGGDSHVIRRNLILLSAAGRVVSKRVKRVAVWSLPNQPTGEAA